MLNQILNSRTILVFIIPFFLGLLSVLSFQPFNITLINFLIIPIFFLILSNINKRSKNKYRKKPYLKNLFFAGYFFGIGFFLSGTYWISYSLTFDENLKIKKQIISHLKINVPTYKKNKLPKYLKSIPISFPVNKV